MTPDASIAARLQSAGVGTIGTNIFQGGTRPVSTRIPHAAIFVLSTGGIGPQPLLVAGASDYSRPTVQILIRGNVGSFLTTQTTARSVITAVQKSTISGYFQVLARVPEPIYLGLDDTEHPMFSVNVELFTIA